jgi:hypothetical protein
MMESCTSYGLFGTSQFFHKDTTQIPTKLERKEREKNDTFYGSF